MTQTSSPTAASSRRNLLKGAALGTFALPGMARASDFPSRPMKIVVPYSAGGTDTQYRKLAELVGRKFGQTVIVENKPGGAGTAGVIQMARTSRPDGYTIGASTAPLLRQPHMQQVDYDPLRDLTWIAGLGSYTFVILVRKDSPFTTLRELLDWAKLNPGRLTYGTPGVSSSQFIAMADLSLTAGVDTLHVPYRGGGEINTAVLGGHTMAGVNTLAGIAGLDGNEVRALACFDPERLAALPDLPTVREFGYDLVHTAPYGIVGPPGMDAAIVSRLQDAYGEAMHNDENRRLIATLHQSIWFRPAAAYREWAAAQLEREGVLINRLGIQRS